MHLNISLFINILDGLNSSFYYLCLLLLFSNIVHFNFHVLRIDYFVSSFSWLLPPSPS